MSGFLQKPGGGSGSGGMVIGGTITGGTANQVLYTSPTGELTSDAGFLRQSGTLFSATANTATNGLAAWNVVSASGVPFGGLTGEGGVFSLNHATSGSIGIFNSDTVGFGAVTGLLSLVGWNDDSVDSQAGMTVSSDGSVFGQTGPSVVLTARDGSTYERSFGVFPAGAFIESDFLIHSTESANTTDTIRVVETLTDTLFEMTGQGHQTIWSTTNGTGAPALSVVRTASPLSPLFTVQDNGIITINNNWNLATADGTVGQVLTTDGAGQTTFQTPTTGLLQSNSDTIESLYALNISETPVINTNGAVWLGDEAGLNQNAGAAGSIFLGYQAGQSGAAGSKLNGVSLGYRAGSNSSAQDYTINIGSDAGRSSAAMNNAVNIGRQTGFGATNAEHSVFIGDTAGSSGVNSEYSVFIGSGAGFSVRDGYDSIMIGRTAGSNADDAANSIFLGREAGNSDTVNNRNNADDFSILIGPYTSTGGFSNSIAMGNNATNTKANQMVIGSATRPITELGIGEGASSASAGTASALLHATNGLGTDIAGADLVIASGAGTGTGVSGDIKIQYAPVSTTGATLNTRDDAVLISGTDGSVSTYNAIFRRPTAINAATYAMATTDRFILQSYSTTGTSTITLRTDQTVDGRILTIKDVSGNATASPITIDTQGSETIDGQASIDIDANYGSITLIAEGGNWYII